MYHVTLTDVIVCDTRRVDHVLLPSCFCPVYFSGETEWVEKYVLVGARVESSRQHSVTIVGGPKVSSFEVWPNE